MDYFRTGNAKRHEEVAARARVALERGTVQPAKRVAHIFEPNKKGPKGI